MAYYHIAFSNDSMQNKFEMVTFDEECICGMISLLRALDMTVIARRDNDVFHVPLLGKVYLAPLLSREQLLVLVANPSMITMKYTILLGNGYAAQCNSTAFLKGVSSIATALGYNLNDVAWSLADDTSFYNISP